MILLTEAEAKQRSESLCEGVVKGRWFRGRKRVERGGDDERFLRVMDDDDDSMAAVMVVTRC